jgi:hypothetical protein
MLTYADTAGASDMCASQLAGAAQTAALDSTTSAFNTHVSGNQLFINNITSICNCEGATSQTTLLVVKSVVNK